MAKLRIEGALSYTDKLRTDGGTSYLHALASVKLEIRASVDRKIKNLLTLTDVFNGDHRAVRENQGL